MHRVHRLVPGLVAGSLLLSGASGVFAAKTHKAHARNGIVAGQVSNVSATGFTLTFTPKTGKNGAAPVTRTFQVATTSTTKEVARRRTTGSIVNGDFAYVAGARTKGAVAAKRVVYSTSTFKLRLHRAIGTVAAGTTATTLVVTTRAGKTATFSVTATTKFRVGKTLQTAPVALTAGQKVLVHFGRDKTVKKQLDALVIRVAAPKAAATATQP
jgi:hypothetical protein